ncbi:YcxB family protein [Acinetobacter bereziniae]|uniref:YcxB family protein n=1 Tax=Acinetobacter TaxID=469 RepID=UPI001900C6DC|nr:MULTISPECIES: YcxB family protein [Acinetobacter]MBJ9373586.1 YcxB family protein [Acinetobacter sp. TGL-Y2]MBJ9950436.1 YcxB family protein [Acinetobacter bereziniae]
MSDTQPALSARYYLNLEESQDGFKLATFGKKQISQLLTPLVSIGIIVWGIYLGLDGVGKYYVCLGAFFLILQMLMRYWFLPMMFKRQFVKYQFGKSEQGIELFQDYMEIFSSGRPKQVHHYSDVQKFAEGKLTYMIELKNRTVVIVPKRAFATPTDQSIFVNTFKK